MACEAVAAGRTCRCVRLLLLERTISGEDVHPWQLWLRPFWLTLPGREEFRQFPVEDMFSTPWRELEDAEVVSSLMMLRLFQLDVAESVPACS